MRTGFIPSISRALKKMSAFSVLRPFTISYRCTLAAKPFNISMIVRCAAASGAYNVWAFMADELVQAVFADRFRGYVQ